MDEHETEEDHTDADVEEEEDYFKTHDYSEEEEDIDLNEFPSKNESPTQLPDANDPLEKGLVKATSDELDERKERKVKARQRRIPAKYRIHVPFMLSDFICFRGLIRLTSILLPSSAQASQPIPSRGLR